MPNKSRSDVIRGQNEGTPPPLITKEGNAEAQQLGAGLNFAAASGPQPYSSTMGKAAERNATRAGQFVDWRTTSIGSTAGARDSDPFRLAADEIVRRMHHSARHEALDLLLELPLKTRDAIVQLTNRRHKALPRKSRSVGMDAVSIDPLDLGRIVGLRDYLTTLRPDEPVDPKVAMPLVRALLRNKGRH